MSNINRLRNYVVMAENDAQAALEAFAAWKLTDAGLVDSIGVFQQKVAADAYLAALRKAWEIVTGEEWPN